MTAFYKVSGQNFSRIATGLVWQSEAQISSGTHYKIQFKELFTKHSDVGVCTSADGLTTVGVISNEAAMSNSYKTAIALASALKDSCDKEGYRAPAESQNDMAREYIDVYVCTLDDKTCYTCGYIGVRVIFDLTISAARPEILADEISSNILKATDLLAVNLHLIGINNELRQSLESAITKSGQDGSIVISSAITVDKDFITLIAPHISKDRFLTNIGKLKTENRKSDAIKLAAIVLIGAAASYYFFAPKEKPVTTNEDKYAVFNVVTEPEIINADNIQATKDAENRKQLASLRYREKQWLENHVRMSGKGSLLTLQREIGQVPLNIEGYGVTQVHFSRPFSGTESDTRATIVTRYKRENNAKLGDFVEKQPAAEVTLDGKVALVSKPFYLSQSPREFTFKSIEVDLTHLITSMQSLESDGHVDQWKVSFASLPQRPEKYSEMQKSLLSTVGFSSGGENSDKWLTEFRVVRLDIEVTFLEKLTFVNQVLNSLETAVVTDLLLDVESHKITIGVDIYEL